MQRVLIQIATLAVAGLVLVGCTASSEPVETVTDGGASAIEETPTLSPTPTQMSDEEALQIGVDTYNKLLEAEFELIRTNGASIDNLNALITENMSEYRDRLVSRLDPGFVTKGSLELHGAKLQRATPDSITFYACVDYSKGWVETADGEVVGGPREGKVGSFEIEVKLSDSGHWQVDRKQGWPGQQHCSSSS